ncbi:MAG: hypothetical protein V1914_04380 [archaeon]
MDKQASTESYSFLIGLVITVVIIAIFMPFIINLFSEEQNLPYAQEVLLNISEFYRQCLATAKTDCICGSFNVYAGIRQERYSLFLSKMMGQSHLLLTNFGVSPDSGGLIDSDEVLAKYSFDEQLVCTFGYDGFELKEFPERYYELTNSYSDEVSIFKTGSDACVIAVSKPIEEYGREFANCYAELDSDKLILLDSGDDVASKQIANLLYPKLIKEVGRVDAFFMGDYDGRSEWFDSVYVKEKEDFLVGRIFLVHVRTSTDSSKDSKDKFIVHYLQDTISGSFAESVGLRLQALSGKYYYNSVKEADITTVPEKYMFNTEVVYEANNVINPDGLYLVCEDDELQICKEKLQIPSVFVEIVDVDDGYSVYQGHEDILAEAIKEGVLSYVKKPAVFEPVQKSSDESLFQ